MRRFTLGSATDRKIVVIELDGTRMSVVQMMPDGSSKRNKKELSSEAEAQAASERMARELISRGFVEQASGGPKPARPTKPGVAGLEARRPGARSRGARCLLPVCRCRGARCHRRTGALAAERATGRGRQPRKPRPRKRRRAARRKRRPETAMRSTSACSRESRRSGPCSSASSAT